LLRLRDDFAVFLRCGLIEISSRPGAARGRGTIIRDNILGGVRGDGSAGFTAEHNLIAEPLEGVGNVTGLPTYVGPAGTYEGYRLAPGSLGTGDASDGGDRGIRLAPDAGASSR
jgi:hypothetical protein